MTNAIKHLDLIVGVDIHLVMAPGPTPLPCPYVGIVFDPFDYLPFVGSTVSVNGLPRAQAGTAGTALPPHIPVPGPFAPPPPTNESEMFMGSSTVAVDGDALTYHGLPVLSCQTFGMPGPARKKSQPPKSLVLPTSIVLSIPTGAPVIVGGPPTISLMSLGMRGLGALGTGIRRLQRGSGRIGKAARALSDKLHARVDALRLGDAARSRLHRAVCTVTGHPVDVAAGKVFTDHVDFELPGPLPLRWERVWYSTSTYRGPLGHGWHHCYDAALYVGDDFVLHRTLDGRYVGFPTLAPGEEYFDRAERLTLLRESGGYVVRASDRTDYVFRDVGRPEGEHVLYAIAKAGDRLEFRYDDRGRLVEIEDSAGRTLQLSNDDRGRVTSVSAPQPDDTTRSFVIVRYVYDGAGNLTRVLDAHGAPFEYAYRRQLLIRETNRNGLSFQFEYDGESETARCVRTWGDGGIYDHRLRYDLERNLTTVTNSLGYETRYQHADGLVVRVVDALGAISRTEYDAHDQKLREIDAYGRDRRYRYDARGNPSEQRDYDGATIRLEHDAGDRLVRAVDANGGVWHWTYDDAGRLVERTNPLGQRQQFTYRSGQLTAVVDALGQATELEYDDMHNVRAVRAPDGSTNAWEYDALGRVVARTDTNGNVQRRRYDLLGRPVEISEPDGNVRKLAYDGEGNLVRVADAHRDVRFTYRGMGRLATRSQAGTTVRFEYDTEEQLIGITNEHGHVYRFELGPTGELRVESGFDGVLRAYERDRVGRVTAVERAGGARSTYRHDPVGRVRAVEHSDGARESYRYRVDGELVEAVNATGAVVFERDRLGRVVCERREEHWVASEYDARGVRVRMRSSLGADQRVERGVMGEVLGVEHRSEQRSKPFEVKFTRDALGLELERSLPGGVRTAWQRDRLGRPIQHEISVRARGLRARTYRWEPDDRLGAILDALTGPVLFQRDALGNLAAAAYADGSRELRMPDAVGNLFRTETRSDRKYGPAGELLESIDERRVVTKYSYDAEGNLTRKQRSDGRAWTYRWGADGTLREVERPDGASVRFEYDALGRRVSKTCGPRTVRWIWDGNLPLHEWTEGDVEPLHEDGLVGIPYDPIDGSSKRREAEGERARPRGPPHWSERAITWLFEPDTFAPLAKLEGERSYSIIADHLGAPYCMLDERGATVWSAELSTWGALRTLEGPRSACPFRWPGQYEDVETGLYYNRFRYYDPEAGQYVSQDPIGLDGGAALYAYAQDPSTWTDPLGLNAGQGCGGTRVPHRQKPRIETGNLKEGWIHIDVRHVSGTHPEPGDLFAPGTTRAQVTEAAEKLVARGTRKSNPSNRIQTFEKRMKINGRRDRVRVIVDSDDGNRVITVFPVRSE